MKYRQMALFLLICALQCLVGNWVSQKGFGTLGTSAGEAAALFIKSVPGMLCLLAIVAGGVLISAVIPWKGFPAVAYIVTLGCVVTVPGFPGAERITEWVSRINFVGLCTPILAYAGLAVGKDLGVLKRTGWKIVLVGLAVFVGTFIGSAVIAELALRAMGKV